MEHTDWLCLAYCLMSNHLHFAMLAGEQPLDSWAKRVNSPFANWLNKQRGRLGAIFAERPSSRIVPNSRTLDVIAYIHNNPVRAKVVNSANESTWSSHRAYVGAAAIPKWLHVEKGLRRCGFGGRPQAFGESVDMLRNRRLIHDTMEGDDTFMLLETSAEFVAEASRARRIRAEDVTASVARCFGITEHELRQRNARGAVSDAKRTAVHVARAVGIPLAAMASVLDVSRQRASMIASELVTDERRQLIANIVAELRRAARAELIRVGSA